ELDFTTDPGWQSTGSGSNGNSFSYSADTTYAGGQTGEAGGRFTRSQAIRSYADTSFPRPFSLADPLQASGKLDVTDWNDPDLANGIAIGHFSTSGSAGLGIQLKNIDSDQLIWFGRLRFDDGTVADLGHTQINSPHSNHTWSYQWDPTGGEDGFGSLLLEIDGISHLLRLTEDERDRGLTNLDAFGFNSDAAADDDSNRYIDLFIDDLVYTSGYEASVLDNDLNAVTLSRLYWTDYTQGTIFRSNADGTEAIPLIAGLGEPHGVVAHPETNQLYWT
ncbi:MAG: hypothetical protein GY917_21935, partial [Planctomycetaceae bacterium]|nr:hypothetical protein [Planctomycetaceae bacterium]